MSYMLQVRFTAATAEDAERFVDEYVLDALDRVRGFDACDAATFAYGHNAETNDRSVVEFVVYGDVDEIVASERDRWAKHVDEGVVDECERATELEREELVERLGEGPADLTSRLGELSTDVAKFAAERIDGTDADLPAVDTHADVDSDAGSVGWWTVLHAATVQLNCSVEAVDAYTDGIEHSLRNVAEYEGETAAEQRLDDVIGDLEAMRDDVTDGRRFTAE